MPSILYPPAWYALDRRGHGVYAPDADMAILYAEWCVGRSPYLASMDPRLTRAYPSQAVVRQFRRWDRDPHWFPLRSSDAPRAPYPISPYPAASDTHRRGGRAQKSQPACGGAGRPRRARQV